MKKYTNTQNNPKKINIKKFLKKSFKVLDKCVFNIKIKKNIKPNTSDASQFHHPPHVPSWTAHQLPNNNAQKLEIKAFFSILYKKSKPKGWLNNFNEKKVILNKIERKEKKKIVVRKKIKGWILFKVFVKSTLNSIKKGFNKIKWELIVKKSKSSTL